MGECVGVRLMGEQCVGDPEGFSEGIEREGGRGYEWVLVLENSEGGKEMAGHVNDGAHGLPVGLGDSVAG